MHPDASGLISVVIPAHNEEKHIKKCIASLKKQTYTPLEIIVADNGSTDKTAVFAREAGVTVVSEPLPGVCAARQAGTEYAHGSIIISSDADTVFPNNWVERIAEVFAKNPDVVAVGGPFTLDAEAPWWGRFIFSDLIFGLLRIRYNLTGKVMNLFGSNTAFRKSAWEGYDTSLNQGGDEVVLLHQLRKKGRIVFLFDNTVVTSSRRMSKGFLYFLIFYVTDYFYSLITGRNLVPSRAEKTLKEKEKVQHV